jgi:hypothetical protein
MDKPECSERNCSNGKLADKHGLSDRYAEAIAREYEMKRRVALFHSSSWQEKP